MKWEIEPSDLVDSAFVDQLKLIKNEMEGCGLYEHDSKVFYEQLLERGWQFECVIESMIQRLEAKRGVSS